MAIKVLGIDKSKVKQATCDNCCSILEYTNQDVTEKTTTDYTGCKDMYKVLVCPVCQSDIYVS